MDRTPLRSVSEPAGEPSDDRLMAECAAGRREAFERLVARHEARLRAFCRLLVGDGARADDVAQDVFLRLWEHRRRYRPEGRLREWLLASARNACRSAARREKVRRAFLGRAEPDEPAVVQDDAGEERALVRAALARLPEKFRVPLALRFFEELGYDEIARVIGRTESATRSRIHYGLKALAGLLPPEVLP